MKVAVAVTGASGSIYALEILKTIQENQSQFTEIGLVWSSNAKTVWAEELNNTAYNDFNFKTYALNDYYAPFASGSAQYDALIICPCSMGTLGRIANGLSDTLITRAADVMLKEQKKLICVVRETPFNLIHIENMLKVGKAGGIICPASPSFYSKPTDFNALARTVTNRALQLAGASIKQFEWGA